MSQTRDEFVELAIELFSEFDVGQDPRENITLENPGAHHPVTGPTPGVSQAGVFFPATYSVREVNDSINTGDVKGIFQVSAWGQFPLSVNTKCVDDTGQEFKVIAFNPSPKDVIWIVQLRKL